MRDTIAIVLGSAGLVFFAGCFLLDRYRTKRELSRWKHTGLLPPEGFDVAARVLKEITGIEGGRCDWVEGPVRLVDGGTAGGLTLDRDAQSMRLTRFPIEQTAFAHEVLSWTRPRGVSEEEYHRTPDFQRRVREANAEVARRLGR